MTGVTPGPAWFDEYQAGLIPSSFDRLFMNQPTPVRTIRMSTTTAGERVAIRPKCEEGQHVLESKEVPRWDDGDIVDIEWSCAVCEHWEGGMFV